MAALPEAVAAPFLAALADSERRVAQSPSSELRRRLTVHLGWVLWSRQRYAQLTSEPGGVVCW
eukprot:6362160-Alexandrium_andersonii.AAC.1